MKTKRLIPLLGFTAGPIIFSLIVPAHAAVLGTIFSDGAVAPSKAGPWLTFTTTTTGTPNQVLIEFAATNLTGLEFVSELFFNVDPSLDLTKLSFSDPTKSGFDLVTLAKEANGFKADGDGSYDIRVAFETSGGTDPTRRFTQGDKVTYTASYDGGGSFSPASFNYFSESGGGSGASFLAAAHLQATPDGGGGSAWVGAVPEPSPAIYTLVATGMCLVFSRKRQHPRS